MIRLLLTSQGLPPELKNVFPGLLTKQPGKISVAFITTAAYGHEKNPEWLDIYRLQLQEYGIHDIEDLDIKHKTFNELNQILAKKDIIYVNGGNTFYLLHWARESGFDRLIPNLLKKGKLYMGVSAGSYICCPTIEQANWKNPDRNKIGMTDLTALNLVPFLISAHYEEKHKSIIEKAALSTKYPIVALNDTQAILVEGENYKLIGKGDKVFFNDCKESVVLK